MPNLKNAIKAVRQTEARTILNRQAKDRITRWLKKTNLAITEKKKETAVKAFTTLTKLLDKAAKEKVIEPNKVSRQKSRVQTKINAL
ncbi:30S ribosomal protein S20 [Candidatus Dojkabacteria bacterium CG_4_10_14_0_2_um_filter_Dojkabacteria_WS6_41_15]|uniref:Small ribosomal subunit protein bS20 n=1 Tax=Candidatus Dojkabacteria bacterium CG_4_10_14_0_2_um_filter_Dojkabacteria_WS6_41_15 TaxID=2014249 RepID=A0A2M7W133_9BACT|nr:MAG: 30S ribosomal protein S20 [Candidatus Dojkabacteria bacterium CG_4_10_14_0_2_um_filter_Dojkabacteria_WS6_41_15]